MPLIPIIKTKHKIKPGNTLLDIQCPPTDNISTAQFAIIGDSPSNIEVIEQEPFVGPSGSQLNRMFAAVNIPRHKLYLTTCCKSFIKGNNINKLWTAKGFRCAEWSLLQQRLIDELSNFNGKIIIAMGATAMKMLIDEPKFDSIGKYRGSIYKADDFPHLKEKLSGKLIALTYHPTFTLARNNPISFYTIIADLNKFNVLDSQPSLLDKKCTIHTRPVFHEVMQFYELVKTKDKIGFDIEATPEYITCFSLAIEHSNESLETMSIPLMNNSGNYWSIEEEIKIWHGLAQILIDPSIGIICQNGMFDIMFVLRTMNIISDNFLFDTMLAQHIVYTDLPKGLDYLTSAYTYFPYYKDEGKKSHLAAIKDWSMYWIYNAKDSAYLLPITTELQKEVKEFGAEDAMKYTMALHKPLMEMEYNGFLTDQVGIKKMRKVLQRKITAMMHGLNKIAGTELNINSSQQLIAYFYGKLMIKPYKNRKTKRPSCDAVALSRIARKKVKGSIEAQMIIKIRTYYKLLSTYFTITVDNDNRLRCTHKISGTVSGRIATEKTFFDTGANLQNQPYIYKKYLISPDDYFLCEVDLAKAEAHVVAYLTQDDNMIAAFESGIDVHSFNASKIFDIPIEDIIAETHDKKIDQKKTKRYMGKKVVHASNYGMGGPTFSDNLAKENIFMSIAECRDLLLNYNLRFPGLKRWHGLIEQEVRENRILYNLFGRPKKFLGLMNSALYRNAYSYKPQSTVAELLNNGAIKIANDPRLGANGYDLPLITTVHDSIVFYCHKRFIPQFHFILQIIKDHLTHTFVHKGKSFTIGLDAKIGYQWAGKTVEIDDFSAEKVSQAFNKLKETTKNGKTE